MAESTSTVVIDRSWVSLSSDQVSLALFLLPHHDGIFRRHLHPHEPLHRAFGNHHLFSQSDFRDLNLQPLSPADDGSTAKAGSNEQPQMTRLRASQIEAPCSFRLREKNERTAVVESFVI